MLFKSMTVGYKATFRGKVSVNRNKRVINIQLTIKEDILACSFANLHCQKAHRHAMSTIDIAITNCVSFLFVSPGIGNNFRHNIVKVVCRSTATLTI